MRKLLLRYRVILIYMQITTIRLFRYMHDLDI